MPRKVVDCRDYPSEKNCTLMMSGEEDEVLRAATEHAVAVHGHQNTPELKEEIRKILKNETDQPQVRKSA
jgi:predicted small metal-binding protein